MNQLANVPTVLQSRTTADSYIWDDPRSPLSISISQSAFDRLQREVLQALQAPLEGGREIGGLLWGRKEVGDSQVTIVENFELVEPAKSAKLNKLCREDSFRFRTSLDQTRSDPHGALSAVGCFRSHLRPDMELSPEDWFHLRRFFPGQDNFFLLIKAPPEGVSGVAAFGGTNGELHVLVARKRAPLRTKRAKYSSAASKDLKLRTGTLAAILVALAAMLMLWHKVLGTRPASLVESSTIGLRIERTLDGLTLRWDRTAKPLLKANQAVLSIRDGGEDKVLYLDLTQTQAGALFYQPHSRDLNFGLTLYRDQRSIARETLRALIADPIGSGSVEKIEHLDAFALSEKSSAQTDSGSRQDLADRQRIPEETATKPVAAAAEPLEADRSNTRPVAPVVTPELSMPPPPEVDGASVVPSGPVPTEILSSNSPTPAPPPLPKGQALVYVGPQVLRRVAPSISREVQHTLTSDVEVEVLVAIDATGKVVKSQVQPVTGSLSRFVADEAVRAAQQYLFRPARKNDLNVPSEMILSFRFRRENR